MIKTIFELIEELKTTLNITRNFDSMYRLFIEIEILTAEKAEDEISDELTEKIKTFLYSNHIEKLEENLMALTENRTNSLNLLTKAEVIMYFMLVLKTVNFVTKDDLLLVKYNNGVFYTGWHDLAKRHRGTVYDINTFEIIAYPFEKFFNLNEVEETSLDKVINLLNTKGVRVVKTDKKDGSAIIVTNHKGKVLINTNGGLDNIQIELATEMFKNQYSYFYNNVPEGYTFVFELIHPDNRIILDYGYQKTLYLLAARDLKTTRLLEYHELLKISEEYNLAITEVDDIKFHDMLSIAKNYKSDNMVEKEGWVMRIVTDNYDLMVKIKLEEYFKISRAMSRMNIRNVYRLIYEGSIDDLMPTLTEVNKKAINGVIGEIYDILALIEKDIISEVKRIDTEFGLNKDTFFLPENKLKIGVALKSIKGKKLSNRIVNIVKGYDSEPKLLEPCDFEKVVEYLNKKYYDERTGYNLIAIKEFF